MTSSGAAEAAYTSWGAYGNYSGHSRTFPADLHSGASKAAINHLAKTVAKEEPSITTIAVRPGMVDTQMQADIREKYLSNMDQDDAEKFTGAHKNGKLLPPQRPAHVIAMLALDSRPAVKEFSGSFLQWNDEKLKNYQD